MALKSKHVSLDATLAQSSPEIRARLFIIIIICFGQRFFKVAWKWAGHSSRHFHFHLIVQAPLRTATKSHANIAAQIAPMEILPSECRGQTSCTNFAGAKSLANVASMKLQPNVSAFCLVVSFCNMVFEMFTSFI